VTPKSVGLEAACESAEEGGAANGEAFFLAQLPTIERAIRFICRRNAVAAADGEDFGSFVKLRLIENEYGILRKFEHRCPFGPFISVVVHRLLSDYRTHLWGKWHPSAEAKRMGELGVALETMLYRDGRTVDDAFPSLLARWPDVTRRQIDELAARLPRRQPKPRAVDLESADGEAWLDEGSVERGALESQHIDASHRIGAVVREAMESMPEEDRIIFRLRFSSEMSVAEIARMLHVEQKPLYRRLQRCLRTFRMKLEKAGFSAADAEEIVRSGQGDFDFGFGASGGIDSPGPSNDESNAGGMEVP
jgi:RNA polymerase sigma factor (sigma-70 family)